MMPPIARADRSMAGAARPRLPIPPSPAWPSDVTAAGIALISAEDAEAQREALGLDDVAPASSAWTTIVLGSDFTTSSDTAVDVTGLTFTPEANVLYEFSAVLMARTTNAAIGPRVGLAWATGGLDGVAMIRMAVTASTMLLAAGNISASLLIGTSTLLDTTGSWPVIVEGTFRAGASPSGAVKLQLASSTAATTVSLETSSFFRYRVAS